MTLAMDWSTLPFSESWRGGWQYPYMMEDGKRTGILPKLLCNSPNAAICGAKAFRLASQRFRKAMPAWRDSD